MGKLIYVASPLTHPDPAVRQLRYEQVRDYVGKKYEEGSQNMYYSPILYSHELGELFNLPHTADFWENMDFLMLDKADELEVLGLDGWAESVGDNGETNRWHEKEGATHKLIFLNDDSSIYFCNILKKFERIFVESLVM
jgi:hypothetical protein